jgi:hypothetical protein
MKEGSRQTSRQGTKGKSRYFIYVAGAWELEMEWELEMIWERDVKYDEAGCFF